MRILPTLMVWCLGAGFVAASHAQTLGSKDDATVPITTIAPDTQGLQNWLSGFRTRAAAAGISTAVMDQALSGLVYDPDVIRRDRNQSEFTKTIWDYLDTAASDARVENGQAALKKHGAVLNQIEAKYGVDKEVVAAIWGLESAYGTFRGSVPTIQSLATLAYDGRRAAFFEAELLAALNILQAGDTVAANMQGSWAGAMGHTQFMPSSFLTYAVDFNGDGKRDVWGDDPTDALASSAAYLSRFGWTKGAPWGLEITLPQGFDYDQTSERVKKPVPEWQALGVRRIDGGDLPDHGAASVLLPGGARGAAFLIFSNFQVIERYNSADAYVIAVGHLADLLKGGARIKSDWPRDLRALTLDERLDLQTRLTRTGFDTQGVDGKMGPNTIAAVKSFQKSKGIIPDGYPSLDVLNRLEASPPLAAGLLTGDWHVTVLAGAALPDTATVTLGFAGSLSGMSGCNSYSGSYSHTSTDLTIGPVAMTRKACPPELMAVEAEFAQSLARVTRFDVADTTLRLYAGDTTIIEARRN